MTYRTVEHIAVVIPARNEEQLLGACLRSIAQARAQLPQGVSSDVVVCADSCTDQTLSIAGRMLANTGVAVPIQAQAAGAARARAAELALARFQGHPACCWLAHTDADCVVPATWLTDQLRLSSSTHALAGIIDIDDFSGHEPWVEQRFRDTYSLFPDGTHPHVHGANLGLRADAYLAIGGWHPLTTGEDHHLWNRLGDAGYTRQSPSSLCVLTSARRTARAPQGFAAALDRHNFPPGAETQAA